ncbi:hypothetical protein HBH52_230590 [Parastagonospora nodorum]|nr:hypothetical protein HBH52_230590 [Parastagonospora nodorum]
MRFFQAVPPLLAAAAAQSLSSIGNVEPTLTQTISGPIQTDRACAQVSSSIADSDASTPGVPAELAMACLKSVPISQTDASKTIEALKKMIQFQSTISYLKNPPKGWPHEKVDLLAGLDDIGNKVKSYQNEYDFEADIASLLAKAHDGHLAFNGMAYAGAFRWRRSGQIALVSASQDGKEIPKVWALGDFNRTNPKFQPSSVTRINDQEIGQFLVEATKTNAYHDPDTQYNNQFFLQPADSFGSFINPRFYPGPSTSITYENGTTRNYTNLAVVTDPDTWRNVANGTAFYENFVSVESQELSKRDVNTVPYHLENPRESDLLGADAVSRSTLPLSYPDPSVSSKRSDVMIAGYFINTAQGQVGVLAVQDYISDEEGNPKDFQRVVEDFISEAKSRKAKVIIDTRTNGGGRVMSGYDMYLQFFPSQKPQTQSRWRGHRASELFGNRISSLLTISSVNAGLFISPFSNDAWLNSELEDVPDWNALYPPNRFNDDNFTTLLKYNLSDPLQTSDTQGIVVTGYGSRANFKDDPFRAEDIVILTDGICASTCSIFLELMVQQSGVRTIAVGGRPQLGPMAAVGGTKGTLVIDAFQLQDFSRVVMINYAQSTQEVADWAEFLPTAFGIAAQSAGINFQDNIRAGLEKDGIPTQFLNDTASCRIWYEPQMYLNVTQLWEKTAAVAFGNNGGLDEGQCVTGSVTSREQQTGRGEGNPTGDGNTNGGDKEDAGAGLRPTLSAVLAGGVVVLVSLVIV